MTCWQWRNSWSPCGHDVVILQLQPVYCNLWQLSYGDGEYRKAVSLFWVKLVGKLIWIALSREIQVVWTKLRTNVEGGEFLAKPPVVYTAGEPGVGTAAGLCDAADAQSGGRKSSGLWLPPGLCQPSHGRQLDHRRSRPHPPDRHLRPRHSAIAAHCQACRRLTLYTHPFV